MLFETTSRSGDVGFMPEIAVRNKEMREKQLFRSEDPWKFVFLIAL